MNGYFLVGVGPGFLIVAANHSNVTLDLDSSFRAGLSTAGVHLDDEGVTSAAVVQTLAV